ncbi:PaaI family thioesterase [Desulfurobacterium sp.]
MGKKINLPERDDFCFVCGRKNPQGMHLTFDKSGETVESVFSLDKVYQGYNNIIHGGVISLILDEAMAHLQKKEERLLTGKITVKFHNPLMAGETVKVIAWIEKDRKKIKETRAVMSKIDGTKIAEAEAIMFVRKERE